MVQIIHKQTQLIIEMKYGDSFIGAVSVDLQKALLHPICFGADRFDDGSDRLIDRHRHHRHRHQ